MASITVVARYPVGPALVWRELRAIDRHVQWMSDAVAITFDSEQREGVGTSFRCTTKVGPFVTHDRMKITVWRENATMGVEHAGLIRGRGVFELRADGTETVVTWREDLYFPWWALGPLGAFVARPVLRAIWTRNLRTLGDVISQ